MTDGGQDGAAVETFVPRLFSDLGHGGQKVAPSRQVAAAAEFGRNEQFSINHALFGRPFQNLGQQAGIVPGRLQDAACRLVAAQETVEAVIGVIAALIENA